MNDYLLETKPRNIIKAIFIAEIERHPLADEVLTREFVEFNFPPFVDFIKDYNKNKNNLDDIRGLSYKCCQYNISILQIIQDFIKLVDFGSYYINIKGVSYQYDANAAIAAIADIDIIKRELKCEIIKIGMAIDYLLSQTNKCKEPLYIENLLCQLLI
jgi:hypothetical protein